MNIQPGFNNQNFDKYQDFDKVMEKYAQNPLPENNRNKNGKKFNFKKFLGLGVAAITVISALFFFLKDKKEARHKTGGEQLATTLPAEQSPVVFSPFLPVDTVSLTIMPDSAYIITRNDYTLFIPPHSLIDQNNNPVEGDIELLFQSYPTIGEIALSDIPMNYDSNETTYAFQSGGMFQLRAYQRNHPININPEKELTIAFKTELDQSGNVYYFNEQQYRWEVAEKDKGQMNHDSITKIINDLTAEALIDDIENQSIVFDLDIVLQEFPVFKPLQGVLFSVNPQDSALIREIAATEWKYVQADINENNMVFCFAGENNQEQKCITTRPVVKGKKDIPALKEKLKAFLSYKRKQKAMEKYNQMREQIYRAFTINRFGIWNCDHPFPLDNAIVQLNIKLPGGKEFPEHKRFHLVCLDNRAIVTGNQGEIACQKGLRYMVWFNDFSGKRIYNSDVFTVTGNKKMTLTLKETKANEMVREINKQTNL